MRLTHCLTTAFLLILALVALPALAADAPAEAPAQLDFDALQGAEMKGGQHCNLVTCPKDTYCCNYSCSRCAPFGVSCTQEACLPLAMVPMAEFPVPATPVEPEAPTTVPEPEEAFLFPGGGQCGDNVCGEDQFCCNASCGICAPIGGACTDVYCPPEY